METRLVPAAGYRLETLRVKGLSRSLSPSNIKALWQAGRALSSAKALLRDLSPAIIIGTGGYACWPMLRAGAALGIPTAVHESNAIPGLAVRMLASAVDRIWLNFKEAGERLSCGEKIRVVGNPLPKDFGSAMPAPLPHGCDRMVLSFGGSLGAAAINRAVLALMEREAAELPNVFHLHAAGRREYDSMMAAAKERGLDRSSHLRILPYIEDMPRQMRAADVVICRAGAMSITELAFSRKTAVLVPSPNVTGNHQYRNATALETAGAAVLLLEETLDEKLAPTVTELLRDEARRHRMQTAIGAFAKENANRQIFEDILSLARR